MIICVNLETMGAFKGNPILEQHKLRYRSIIDRQKWDVPHYHQLEYDQYDNPAATYLIWRDDMGGAGGVSRLYPTNRPYMLKEVFSFLTKGVELPEAADILEGSRFCVDKNLPAELRQRVCQELIISYLEYGLKHGVKQFVGVMLPIYWRNLFTGLGWDVEFFGESVPLENGQKVRAGGVMVSEEALMRVREKTGIYHPVLVYRDIDDDFIHNFQQKAA